MDLTKLRSLNADTAPTLNQYQLLKWVDNKLQYKFNRIDEMATGAAYCQLLDRLFPNLINLDKVQFEPRNILDTLSNFNMLECAIKKQRIPIKYCLRDLYDGSNKYEKNLKFLNLLKQFYDRQLERPHYDALKQRNYKKFLPHCIYNRRISACDDDTANSKSYNSSSKTSSSRVDSGLITVGNRRVVRSRSSHSCDTNDTGSSLFGSFDNLRRQKSMHSYQRVNNAEKLPNYGKSKSFVENRRVSSKETQLMFISDTAVLRNSAAKCLQKDDCVLKRQTATPTLHRSGTIILEKRDGNVMRGSSEADVDVIGEAVSFNVSECVSKTDLLSPAICKSKSRHSLNHSNGSSNASFLSGLTFDLSEAVLKTATAMDTNINLARSCSSFKSSKDCGDADQAKQSSESTTKISQTNLLQHERQGQTEANSVLDDILRIPPLTAAQNLKADKILADSTRRIKSIRRQFTCNASQRVLPERCCVMNSNKSAEQDAVDEADESSPDLIPSSTRCWFYSFFSNEEKQANNGSKAIEDNKSCNNTEQEDGKLFKRLFNCSDARANNSKSLPPLAPTMREHFFPRTEHRQAIPISASLHALDLHETRRYFQRKSGLNKIEPKLAEIIFNN